MSVPDFPMLLMCQNVCSKSLTLTLVFTACGPEEEDELYESSIIKTNMVYRLMDGALHPYEQYWGTIPKHEMLGKKEVHVFEFVVFVCSQTPFHKTSNIPLFKTRSKMEFFKGKKVTVMQCWGF